MKQFRIIRVSNSWSTARLVLKVEKQLKQLNHEGYEIISVSFGYSIWLVPTTFITAKKIYINS